MWLDRISRDNDNTLEDDDSCEGNGEGFRWVDGRMESETSTVTRLVLTKSK